MSALVVTKIYEAKKKHTFLIIQFSCVPVGRGQEAWHIPLVDQIKGRTCCRGRRVGGGCRSVEHYGWGGGEEGRPGCSSPHQSTEPRPGGPSGEGLGIRVKPNICESDRYQQMLLEHSLVNESYFLAILSAAAE